MEEGIIGMFTELCLFGFRFFCNRSSASGLALRINAVVSNVTTVGLGAKVY